MTNENNSTSSSIAFFTVDAFDGERLVVGHCVFSIDRVKGSFVPKKGDKVALIQDKGKVILVALEQARSTYEALLEKAGVDVDCAKNCGKCHHERKQNV